MAEEHAGPKLSTYVFVFIALCICTAISFVVNRIMGENHQSAAIIMVVSIVKASLVASIFMHLKYDWGKLYCIVIPISILTVMMVIILSIDQTLAWHAYPESVVPLIEPK